MEAGILGLPSEVRFKFNDECRNALLDTRDKVEASLSPSRAAALLRQRILGGVQVRLSFQVTPDPLNNVLPPFNEDDLFALNDAAWNHLVGMRVQQAAQQMKVNLTSPIKANEDPLETLRETSYAEIITYKDADKGVVFKFVGDASMAELMMAAEQYAEKKKRAAKRETRCDAIIRKMKQRGCSETDTVSEALERKAKLTAV